MMFGFSPRRFIIGFWGLVFGGVAAVALANLLIDPYWRFGSVEIDGVNAFKPDYPNKIRMVKANYLCKQRPANVILGTSRAEIGIDPDYAAWKAFPGPTYNLAMPGAGITEIYDTLRHAYYASGRLKLAVIGLDFLMFNAWREARVFGDEVKDFDRGRLLLDGKRNCLDLFLYDIDNLLGKKAAVGSWRTITGQRLEPLKREFFLRNGMRDAANTRLTMMADITGQNFLFQGQGYAYVNQIWRVPPQWRYCLAPAGMRSTLDVFRDIVAFARAKGIDLRFYTSPNHARMWTAAREAGLWPIFEDWKRGMTEILAKEAARSGAEAFPLWDFSGFNTVTMEPIPPAGDIKARMKWYWESAHFTARTGNRILDRVLGYRNDAAAVPDDFGVVLTPATLPAKLARDRLGALVFAARFPAHYKQIRGDVDKALRRGTGSNCGAPRRVLKAGLAALAAGDRVAAEADFARALRLQDAEKRRFAQLGVPYREMELRGDIERARAGYRPDRPLDGWLAYYRRAEGLAKRGFKYGAIADFGAAAALQPNNPAIYFLRSMLEMELGDYDGAIADLEAAKRIDPTNSGLQMLLQRARSRLALVGGVAMRAPLEALRRRADRLAAKGDLAGAATAYEALIRDAMPDSAVFYRRGNARAGQGDPAGAIRLYFQGLRIDPKDGKLLAALDRSWAALARLGE
jgi:tetratricopeptide (TPR) repeat protein